MVNKRDEKNIGIVLRSYFPQKNKAVILDRHLGKITCVVKTQRLCVGAVATYQVTHQRNLCFINNFEMIDIPFLVAQADILFLHHVLEICHYFIPMSSCEIQIFDLILFLYDHVSLVKASWFKKFFLFKLFTILGLYPEKKEGEAPYFYQVLSLSIDKIAQKDIDLKIEKALENWLLKCIYLHPYVGSFKTVHFLTENRVP
jgi:hypothetical protein